MQLAVRRAVPVGAVLPRDPERDRPALPEAGVRQLGGRGGGHG
ncbi:hypothetical protein ABZ780_22410 [Micromonospora sp. NPDC047467]